MGSFIPEILSKEILASLKKVSVFQAISNQNWEGELNFAGDKVDIFQPGSVTSRTYTEDTDITAPETPTDAEFQLVVNQQTYFNFKINRKLQRQSQIKNRALLYAQEAAYSQRDKIDQFGLGLYTGVAAGNVVNAVGSGALLTTSNVYTFFNEMKRKFAEGNVPQIGLYSVVPPLVTEIIRAYFAGRSTQWGDEVSANGYAGNFNGFEIFESNNVTMVEEDLTGDSSDNDVYKCLTGVRSGITYANQINPDDIKEYEPEKRFEVAYKGLTIYGAKMLDTGKRNGLMNLAVV